MTGIAIIGMSCRTAGAETPAQLWDLLEERGRRVRDVPADRWPGLDPGVPLTGPPRAALLDRIDEFGAALFGIAPRMAAWMDPQQRLLLELAWQAVEDAGLDPDRLARRPVAVFAGATMSDYRERMAADGVADSAALPGALTAFLANRVSHQFDWTGPSLVVDSACSSGLSALGLAVQGLRDGEFPMALVGAPSVLCNAFYSNTAYRGGALSPSGDSVPFSASRDGYVRGEGGACVLLKPLEAAVDDGDPVRGVILAVGTAHNGRGGGLTGSDAESQELLFRRTARRAGREVRDIGYVEAHATGTPAGDAVEVAALARALQGAERAAGPSGRVWMGSAKASVGHLEAAAGLIGLVTAVLVLEQGRIPGIAALAEADGGLPIGGAPVAVATEAVEWPPGDRPRLVAVNAFGLGGSLSQALVEEAPAARAERSGDTEDLQTVHAVHVVPLSAETPEGLRILAARLLRGLDDGAAPLLASVAWTLQSARRARPVRRALVVADLGELRSGLALLTAGGEAASTAADGRASAAAALGQAWEAGQDVDWATLWGPGRPRRVNLPGPPLSRRSFWYDRRRPLGGSAAEPG